MLEASILRSTKKVLNLQPDYTAFDQDVMMHINMALSTASQLGVGPVVAVQIQDDSTEWDDLGLAVNQVSMLKSYVFLKTKMVFDPPPTSFAINAAQEQIKELEVRMNTYREGQEHPLGGTL